MLHQSWLEQVVASRLMVNLSLLVRQLNAVHNILADHEATLPSQKGEAISSPTLGWIFQLIEGNSLAKSDRKTWHAGILRETLQRFAKHPIREQVELNIFCNIKKLKRN